MAVHTLEPTERTLHGHFSSDREPVLTVDPGDTLRPRRQIELILLPGISDIDGLTLISRGASLKADVVSQKNDVVDVLRYRVGS